MSGRAMPPSPVDQGVEVGISSSASLLQELELYDGIMPRRGQRHKAEGRWDE